MRSAASASTVPRSGRCVVTCWASWCGSQLPWSSRPGCSSGRWSDGGRAQSENASLHAGSVPSVYRDHAQGRQRRDGAGLVRTKDGSFWINGGTNRGWFKHLQRDPRITLLLIDPKEMFRWAQVEGRMVNWAEDPGGDHINHLSHRYLGRDYQNPRTGRIKIQIEPLRVTGWVDGWR